MLASSTSTTARNSQPDSLGRSSFLGCDTLTISNNERLLCCCCCCRLTPLFHVNPIGKHQDLTPLFQSEHALRKYRKTREDSRSAILACRAACCAAWILSFRVTITRHSSELSSNMRFSFPLPLQIMSHPHPAYLGRLREKDRSEVIADVFAHMRWHNIPQGKAYEELMERFAKDKYLAFESEKTEADRALAHAITHALTKRFADDKYLALKSEKTEADRAPKLTVSGNVSAGNI
jgi:hypothetical protein